MKALIVTDMQQVITDFKDFGPIEDRISQLINLYRDQGHKVIFTKHISQNPEDHFYFDKPQVGISCKVYQEGDLVIEKLSPSVFKETDLDAILKEADIKDLTFVGFNTEFCCLFSAVAAYDRGYQVTFVEDAIGTCNDAETYEMPGLDINDFVGTFLDWSGVVRVEYTEDLL